ncbi:hypothetical protein DSUL_80026 [Desulfovibrionales bacterium]
MSQNGLSRQFFSSEIYQDGFSIRRSHCYHLICYKKNSMVLYPIVDIKNDQVIKLNKASPIRLPSLHLTS